VAAPLFEELFFRGFLLQGLHRSRIRPWGAVLCTSLFWTVFHAGYDLYALFGILLGGLLLGLVWLRTRSVWPGVFLHALMNLVATVQTAWVVARG
jgi:membrane protease YdiL (CAAX protease family)